MAEFSAKDVAELRKQTGCGMMDCKNALKDANGNFDCTIKSSETIRLSVSGTDAAATWAVADASVLSISADGLITPAKVGTTTVTATVGGAVLTITVRIK